MKHGLVLIFILIKHSFITIKNWTSLKNRAECVGGGIPFLPKSTVSPSLPPQKDHEKSNIPSRKLVSEYPTKRIYTSAHGKFTFTGLDDLDGAHSECESRRWCGRSW